MRSTPLLLLLLLAGCVAPAPAAEPLEPAPERLALAGEGRTEGLACVGPGGNCHIVEGSLDVEVPMDRAPVGLVANVTWTPRDPTLTDMEVFLLSVDEAGEWSWEESPDTYWVGASPLTIESRFPTPLPARFDLHARVRHVLPDGSRAGLSQPYTIEGSVLVPGRG